VVPDLYVYRGPVSFRGGPASLGCGVFPCHVAPFGLPIRWGQARSSVWLRDVVLVRSLHVIGEGTLILGTDIYFYRIFITFVSRFVGKLSLCPTYCLHIYVLLLASIRDGNGYPQPDTRWVFTPLWYAYGLNILPVGQLLGKNLHPLGKRVLERSTFTHTR
jgi:hypothetical protein